MLTPRRVQITGNSCSGKSTLGKSLADFLDLEHVEIDALNWMPEWVALSNSDPAEFEQRIRHATRGDRWVVSGSYSSFSERLLWPRLDTLVWLDLPLPTQILRMLKRSWLRWRSGELLWGCNREKFWQQLMIWRGDESLLWWIITTHTEKRQRMQRMISDPRWQHIHFIRLTSSTDVKRFIEQSQSAPLIPNPEKP